MSQVIIRSTDDPETWVLVELQGELSARNDSGEEFGTDIEGFHGLQMGLLTTKFGRPHLRIGNHVLEGKTMKLNKPLVVTLPDSASGHLIAPSVTSSSSSSSSSSNGMQDNESKDSTDKQLRIVGVIREKLIFSSRPKPVVSQRNKIDTDTTSRVKLTAKKDSKAFLFTSPPAAKNKKKKINDGSSAPAN